MTGSDRCGSHLGRVGRPSQLALTPELAERMEVMLKAGNYVAVALRAVGLAHSTFKDWMVWGRAGREPYAEFAERIERALAEGESRNVAQIAVAAKEHWQAAAWILERAYPERWGRVSTRLRETPADDDQPTSEPEHEQHDPFREVDELSARRRARAGL